MRLGSHLSIAGGMTNALDEAERLGLDCVQVFTKNQQQWRAPVLKDDAVEAWRSRVKGLGWEPQRLVSHASYLINLASPDDELWRKSVDLMQEEIDRCERLGIAWLVHHPGAFTTSDLESGLVRIAEAYRELFRRTKGYRTVSCLENTVGGRSTIGRTFEELAALRTLIIQVAGSPERVGFCFDTCHAHAGGYDLGDAGGQGEERGRRVLDEFDAVVGLQHLRVVHLNDSKTPAGSRRDRHEHIGKGTIGLGAFRAVITRDALQQTPMILETPKGTTPKGTPLDTLNLRRLRRLVKSG